MALIGLGVSGGIGAYKAIEVCRGLQKRGHDVVAIMTRSATRFVGPVTFEAITRRRVITSQWKPGANADIEHISIATDISLLVVAPCTANIIGKFAHGIADDFLTSLYLATRAPVLLAPAMNTNMLAHPAVRSNLDTLAARGVRFVDPGEGYLACGWIGKGRLAEPDDIVEAAVRALAAVEPAEAGPHVGNGGAHVGTPASTLRGQSGGLQGGSAESSLRGQHVLVTAGPTYEDIDPVRYVGNRSSGRMGFAVAAEATRRGARVTLIAGPTAVAPPAVDEVVKVRSAAEMHAEVMRRAGDADVVVMAAAVADYAPARPSAGKIAKTDAPLTVTFERTRDILTELGRLPSRASAGRPLLVGFAAETSDTVAKAREKRARKNADLIVANDVSRTDAGFEVDTNAVTLVTAEGEDEVPLRSKAAVAGVILDRVERLLRSRAGTPARA